MRNKAGVLTVLLLMFAATAFAADTVLTWPADGKEPMVKFTIGKMRQVNSYSGQTDYVADAMVENLGKKPMPFASFYIYLLDKNKKRIGEGYVEVSNLGVGQQAKVAVSAHAMGSIASMELQPQHLPSDEPVKAKVKVTSVPSGANLKIDGQDAGVTPQTMSLAPGKHVIEFSKEGYAAGTTPIEVAPGALPSAVTLELSQLREDTVVLRDGTVVLGNVSSVTATGVTVNLKGKVKKFDRNQVARVIFAQSPERKAVKRSAGRGK